MNSTADYSAETIRSRQYSWRELKDMIFSYQRELWLANIIAILGALAAVPVPLLIPLLVDEVLLHQPGNVVAVTNQLFPQSWHSPTLYILVVLLLTLILRMTTLVLGVWQMRQFTYISKRVIFNIRETLLLRLERVTMSEYETLGSSTVASHLVTDLDAIDEFVSVSTSKFLVAVLSIIGTAVVLLWMNWQLGLFILLFNPIVIYITTIFGHKVKQLKKQENSAYQLFQETLAETLDAIQQIRASNRERHYIHRIVDSAAQIRTHSSAFTWKSDAANRLSFVVFLFGFDIFRILSMFMVLYSDLSIGQMLAVFAYLWFMMAPVQEVLGIQYAFHAAEAALKRINRLMDISLEPRYPHSKNPFNDKITTSVQLDRICFSYDGETQVLNNVSLNIQAGEKVALVGASGGGKTTLVQIILGLYIPSSGQVSFDQVPVDEIGLDVVRENVATVLQHPALLNDSVRMNLTLGKPYTDEQLWQALEVAQLKDTVLKLDQQLDTLVGRNGIRLSGGQRQRLAIARMVLTEPKIVILDEATSALDTTTETRLHQALRDFLKQRTTLIIAHRLSAVKQADRVLVFEDGEIVEQGHHDELIQQQGLYASLYGKQHHEQND
ncbi:MAG: ABC transporter ATP-binding protein [Chromatiales bacterium]|jgi:ATP-binding cassette subfamily C protein